MSKISERALAQSVPKSERPISELFRLAGLEYADLNAAASLKEELRTATLARWKQEVVLESGGNMPDNKAERIVKSSERWVEYNTDMVEQRRLADRARVQMKYYEIMDREKQSQEATARREMGFGR